MSNLHHQTANASTNTPIHENLCLTPYITSPIASKSISTELGMISTAMKTTGAPSSSSSSLPITVNSGHLSNKINKISSNVNQQESSSFNFLTRPETNQESTSLSEKKTVTIDYSYLNESSNFIYSLG